MKKILTAALIAASIAPLVSGHAFGAGGRGGRGGGGRGGGGGVSRGGGGGVSRGGGSSGMSRPTGGSAPSFSRPSASTRPAGGGANIGGGGRPSTLPSTRPSVGDRPGVGTLPSTRPNVGDRPNVGTRPTQPTTRPNVGNVGDRTAISNTQIGISGRPTQLPAPGNRGGAQGRIDNRGGRTENRGDRIANRDERGENRHDMWHDIHDDWHHGHWHDIDHPWAAAAGIAAITPWSWGSYWYSWGYYPYTNPYYVPTQTTVVVESPAINYSQPIDTTATSTEEKPLVSDEALTAFDEARAAFYAVDYAKARQQVEKSLAKMPTDTTMYEFRSLVLFAMKKYKDSAAGVYSVLAVAPGWDWTTMSGLYPDVDVYTAQLRALEGYAKQNPKAPEGHFLLAYHYMTGGHDEEAAGQLEQVVKLTPNDQVAQQLLQLTKGASGEQPTPAPSKPADDKPPASVVGNWKAPSGDGSIELAMKQDGTFAWKYTSKGKSNAFGGKYQLAGNTLVLETEQGGTMVGKVSAKGTGFHFQMLGGPSSDPGLTFGK